MRNDIVAHDGACECCDASFRECIHAAWETGLLARFPKQKPGLNPTCRASPSRSSIRTETSHNLYTSPKGLSLEFTQFLNSGPSGMRSRQIGLLLAMPRKTKHI